MFTRALHIPGPCQRPGCEKSDSIKIKVEGDLFKADPERGLEAGYRLYGIGCCAGKLLGVVEPFEPTPRKPRQRST